MASTAKRFVPTNREWRNARAAHARYMAKPMRPIREHAAEKAIEYAEWLAARDGLDVEQLARQFRDAHNATRPPEVKRNKRRRYEWTIPHPEAIRDDATLERHVEYGVCSAGKRPCAVHFRFSADLVVMSTRLPNWDHVHLDNAEELAA